MTTNLILDDLLPVQPIFELSLESIKKIISDFRPIVFLTPSLYANLPANQPRLEQFLDNLLKARALLEEVLERDRLICGH